jgi:uncharacterized OB-fold protein
MTWRYVAENLIVGEGEAARLLGARRRSDGHVIFPFPEGADQGLYEPLPLSTEGTLWSYTVQRFRPKPPYNGPGDDKDFQPYAVGYVELPGEIIVESRIVADPEQLKIGMPVTFTLLPYRQDADGSDVLTYAFRPA